MRKKSILSYSILLLFILLIGSLMLYKPLMSFADANPSNSNSCSGTQSGKNDNSNCNQQNQNQNQDQTQNNDQNVNLTLTQNQSAPAVFAVARATSLPSTGTPIEVWELLGGIAPLGIFLRKFAAS